MTRALSVTILLTAGLLASPAPARADLQRGRLLYENHCQACHASTVHVREHRKAKSPAELRAYIQRWAGELKLPWTADEVDDVYQHLNNLYYKFPVGKPSR